MHVTSIVKESDGKTDMCSYKHRGTYFAKCHGLEGMAALEKVKQKSVGGGWGGGRD